MNEDFMKLMVSVGFDAKELTAGFKATRALAESFGTAMDTVGKSLGKVGGGVDKWLGEIQKTSKGIEGFGSAATKAFGLVAAGATAAAGSLTYATYKTMEYSDSLNTMANMTGIGAGALEELKFAAEQSNTSLSTVQMGWRKMTAALNSGSKDTKKAVSDLGLSFKDLRLSSPEEQLTKVFGALSKLPSEAERTRLAMEMFGPRIGASLKGLASNAEGLRKEFQNLGLGIGEAGIKAAAAMKDQFAKLGSVRESLTMQMGDIFTSSPAMKEALDWVITKLAEVGQYIKANKQYIQDGIASAWALFKNIIDTMFIPAVEKILDYGSKAIAKIIALGEAFFDMSDKARLATLAIIAFSAVELTGILATMIGSVRDFNKMFVGALVAIRYEWGVLMLAFKGGEAMTYLRAVFTGGTALAAPFATTLAALTITVYGVTRAFTGVKDPIAVAGLAWDAAKIAAADLASSLLWLAKAALDSAQAMNPAMWFGPGKKMVDDMRKSIDLTRASLDKYASSVVTGAQKEADASAVRKTALEGLAGFLDAETKGSAAADSARDKAAQSLARANQMAREAVAANEALAKSLGFVTAAQKSANASEIEKIFAAIEKYNGGIQGLSDKQVSAITASMSALGKEGEEAARAITIFNLLEKAKANAAVAYKDNTPGVQKDLMGLTISDLKDYVEINADIEGSMHKAGIQTNLFLDSIQKNGEKTPFSEWSVDLSNVLQTGESLAALFSGKLQSGLRGASSLLGGMGSLFGGQKDKDGKDIGSVFGNLFSGQNIMKNLSSAIPAIAAMAGPVMQAIGSWFESRKIAKVGKEVGKMFGTSISKELSKELSEQAKKLGLNVSETALLNISKIAADSGKSIRSMGAQIGDLFGRIKSGALPSAEGMKSLGETFSKVREEAESLGIVGDRTTVNMLKQARAMGMMTSEMKAFSKEQVALAVAGANKIAEGLAKAMEGEGGVAGLGTDAATLFMGAFNAAVSEEGWVKAAESMRSGFEKMKKALGDDEAAMTLLAPFERFLGYLDNEVIAGLLTIADGTKDVITGLANAGYLSAEQFQAATGLINSTFAKMEIEGVLAKDALLAIAPALAAAISASEQYGIPLDEKTLALKEAAEAAGVKFPIDPLLQIRDILGSIATALGAEIPESARAGADAVAQHASDSAAAETAAAEQSKTAWQTSLGTAFYNTAETAAVAATEAKEAWTGTVADITTGFEDAYAAATDFEDGIGAAATAALALSNIIGQMPEFPRPPGGGYIPDGSDSGPIPSPDFTAATGFYSASMPRGPHAEGMTMIGVHPNEEVSVTPAGKSQSAPQSSGDVVGGIKDALMGIVFQVNVDGGAIATATAKQVEGGSAGGNRLKTALR